MHEEGGGSKAVLEEENDIIWFLSPPLSKYIFIYCSFHLELGRAVIISQMHLLQEKHYYSLYFQ